MKVIDWNLVPLKIGLNETRGQFASHLGRSLDDWLQSRKVFETFGGLRSTILTDHFLTSLTAVTDAHQNINCFRLDQQARLLIIGPPLTTLIINLSQ